MNCLECGEPVTTGALCRSCWYEAHGMDELDDDDEDGEV